MRAAPVALLLDEMFSPAIAARLRERGHDVISVADDPDLRSMPDEVLWTWAGTRKRRLVTENVKDFRPLLHQAEESGDRVTALLFTSNRTFPRSRRSMGPLVDSLHAWLCAPDAGRRPTEDWLRATAGSDHKTAAARKPRR